MREGAITHRLDISDVWKHTTFREHESGGLDGEVRGPPPNLVALEFSSFKCGHDAPVYSVVEEVIESAGRPYLAFKDLDENSGAFRGHLADAPRVARASALRTSKAQITWVGTPPETESPADGSNVVIYGATTWGWLLLKRVPVVNPSIHLGCQSQRPD